MKVSAYLSRTLAVTLVTAIAGYGIGTPAHADLVPTSELLAETQSQSMREQVSTLLQQDEVATMLTGMGVDVEAARDRVGSLTTTELQQLSSQLQDLPAGEGALGTIAMILFILILLDIAGVTDIFPAV